jgi:nitrate/TMAO reductase-like tetraheme cytochrome c subunit
MASRTTPEAAVIARVVTHSPGGPGGAMAPSRTHPRRRTVRVVMLVVARRAWSVHRRFDHAIAGTGDCKSCHAVQSATQRDWSGGSFSHSPAPTACIDCHLGIRPVGPAGTPPFDHANGGTGDCVSCHRPKSATQTNWSGAGFSHSPTPATCNGCHVPESTDRTGRHAFIRSCDCRNRRLQELSRREERNANRLAGRNFQPQSAADNVY